MRPIVATDLMNSELLTVSQDLPLRELAELLVAEGISGAPVLDEQGYLVGVVSLVDVARAAATPLTAGGGYLQEPEGAPIHECLDEAAQAQIDALTVADVMTPDPYTVGEDARVSEIAALMVRYHLHRVLVVQDRELVGIISTTDLLGLLIDED